MPTVYILGAGASKGASPIKPNQFPLMGGMLRAVREWVSIDARGPLKALCCYLNRFAPVSNYDTTSGALNSQWDDINIEEMCAAIEFETRLTEHLACDDQWLAYFPENYCKTVEILVKEDYKNWLAQRYTAPWNKQEFPYLHKNFLMIVYEELLDAISYVFHRLTINEDTSLLERLVSCFQPGDCIITFNYDLLIEKHLCNCRPCDWSFYTGYDISSVNNSDKLIFLGDASKGPSKFKLLKLHGSCNWHFQIKRKGTTRIPQQIGAGFDMPNDVTDGLVVTDSYGVIESTDESYQGYYNRFMIPPTTYKAEHTFSGQFLYTLGPSTRALSSSKMWQPQRLYFRALKALVDANRVIFIGYSVPTSDTSVRMLLRTAADRAETKQIVLVVNPDSQVTQRVQTLYPCTEVKNYKSLISYLDDG